MADTNDAPWLMLRADLSVAGVNRTAPPSISSGLQLADEIGPERAPHSWWRRIAPEDQEAAAEVLASHQAHTLTGGELFCSACGSKRWPCAPVRLARLIREEGR